MKLYSIIKNTGPGDLLVWKFPDEDFNKNSQLIVSESEEALFVKDGIVVEVFCGGKYTLSTNNYPFLSKLRNVMSDGVSSFNCKVYFISKTHKLELLWGTDTPIPMRDAEFGFLLGVRANGSYSIQIENTKQFFIKLIGQNVLSFGKEDLTNLFRSAFLMHIKAKLSDAMKQTKTSVFDVSTEYASISEAITFPLSEVLNEYGVRLVNFYIKSISVPEDDPNFEAVNIAYQKKAEITIQGKDWARISSKEILTDVAKNPGSGGIASAGAGIGMGVAAGGAVGNLAKGMFSPMNENTQKEENPTTNQHSRYTQKKTAVSSSIECPKCGTQNSKTSKFCSECGLQLIIEKKKCPNCGTEILEGAKFCSNCGKEV